MRHQDEPGRREPHMNNANSLMLLFLHNHLSALLTLTRHAAYEFKAAD
jgi:hypothetical protein